MNTLVLELADKLDLTTDQHAKVQALFDAMKAEAVPLGSRLIDQEAALDNEFATHTITPDSLKAATAEVATTQGMLRETHLKYHLATIAILSVDQMHLYSELRGYGDQSMMHRHN
jgi:hypothetical protein